MDVGRDLFVVEVLILAFLIIGELFILVRLCPYRQVIKVNEVLRFDVMGCVLIEHGRLFGLNVLLKLILYPEAIYKPLFALHQLFFLEKFLDTFGHLSKLLFLFFNVILDFLRQFPNENTPFVGSCY